MPFSTSVREARFSLWPVVTMVCATALGTVAMLSGKQSVFGGHQGYPFAWYSWLNIPDRTSSYAWGLFAADVVIWIAVVVSSGVLVERMKNKWRRSLYIASIFALLGYAMYWFVEELDKWSTNSEARDLGLLCAPIVCIVSLIGGVWYDWRSESRRQSMNRRGNRLQARPGSHLD